MSYEKEDDAGVFSDPLFGLGDSGDGLGDLGLVAPITGALPTVHNTAVVAMQNDLITLGLLPRGSADGFFGQITLTAMGRAATGIGFTGQRTSSSITSSGIALTVSPDLLEAIHEAAVRGSLVPPQASWAPQTPSTTPSPSGKSTTVDESGIWSPKTPTDDTPLINGMVTPTPTTGILPGSAAAPSRKWMPYAVAGGGLLLAGGILFAATRKKTTVTKTTVAANSRRRRRS